MTTAAARGPLATMLFGAVLISTSAVFVRWVEMGPTASAFWRMALATAMLLPVLHKSREAAKSTVCLNNLRNLHLATLL